MAKNYLILFILIYASSFMINAMERGFGSQVQPGLFVRNASNWGISVFWQTADKKEFNTVVPAHSLEKLDALENVNKLEIRTYVKYLGFFARKYAIPLPVLGKDYSLYDEYVHVDGSYYLPWLWTVKHIRRLKPRLFWQ